MAFSAAAGHWLVSFVEDYLCRRLISADLNTEFSRTFDKDQDALMYGVGVLQQQAGNMNSVPVNSFPISTEHGGMMLWTAYQVNCLS